MTERSEDFLTGKVLRHDQREAQWRLIENKTIANFKLRYEAALRLAKEVTPLLNTYVATAKQDTAESQRRLCEELRDYCKANDLAVKCPKTGLPTLVYETPRTDRGGQPRISYHCNERVTSYASRLENVALVPSGPVTKWRGGHVCSRDNSRHR